MCPGHDFARRDESLVKHLATLHLIYRRPLHGEPLMKRTIREFIRKSLAIVTAFVALSIAMPDGAAVGQAIGYTTGTYSQNFQTMPTNATSGSMTLNQMYQVTTLAGSGSATGWYAYLANGSSGNRWVGTDGGSSTTGGFRIMYSSSGGNLALGSQGSSNAQGFYGVVLQNNSGSTINTVSLSWDAVINRNPATTRNSTALSWLVSGSNVVTGATGTNGTFNNSAGSWTTPGGSFSYSTPSSGTGASGTQAAINPMFTFAQPTGNLSSLSWTNGSYLYLRWSETDDSGSDATFGIDNFNLWTSAVAAANLTWNVTNGTWNTSTTNWLNGASAAAYVQGDNVTFSGTDGGTIAISGSLAPESMTISATAGTYTFTGATAGDKISGATNIAKSGAGTAVFTSANDFTGGVTITGGVVSISGADQLGNGTITVNGGQMTSTAGSALTLANALTVGGSNGTIDTGAENIVVNGGATLGGVLTKTGNGTLVLASPTLSTGAGFTVSAGSVQIGGPTTSGVYSLATANDLTGNLTIGGTQRLNVNAGGSITGSGTLQFLTTGALLTQQSGFTGGTVSAPIKLNSGNAAFTAGVYSPGSYTPASFVSTIGATSGASGTAGTLTVNSAITGDADVNISNSSANGGGRGLLILGGQSTYTGNTMIDANTPDGFSAVAANVQIVVNNALPTTTGLIYGTRTGAGAAVIDLNGFNQQVAFVGDGAQFTAGSKFLTITNLGTGTSTFTVSGTTDSIFGGVLTNSLSGRLALVKAGSSTLTLSGSSAFSGGTTINGGVISIASDSSLGASSGGVSLAGGTLVTTENFTLSAARIVTVSGTSGWDVAATKTVTFNGDFSGSGRLNKGGLGQLTLGGTSAGYTGTFAINAGTVELTNADALDNAIILQTGGTLILAPSSGSDVPLPGLQGNGGEVSIGNGRQVAVGDNSDRSYGGRIRGQGGFKKQGTGRLELTGNNDYSGTTLVNSGRLVVNGSLSQTPLVTVASGAEIGGSGSIGGTLAGAGAVGPGNSPGIFSAPNTDPSGGLDYNFEFTGLTPDYANAAASVNDVLRLTDTTTPFLSSLGVSNAVKIYLPSSVAEGQTYVGGFFLDATTAQFGTFLGSIASATFSYFVQDNAGGVTYEGLTYRTLGDWNNANGRSLSVTIGTSNVASAAFVGGTITNGQSMQMVIVPEPSAFALAGLGAALAGYAAWKRRRPV